MFGADTLIFSPATVAVIAAVCVGFAAFWSNPHRPINRAFFVASLHVAAWLACWHMAATSVAHGLFWLRWTCAIGALVPLSLWLVMGSILTSLNFSDRRWLFQNAVWLVVPLGLAIIPFTDFFIPSYSSDTERLRGWGYYGYWCALVGLYIFLLREALKSIRTLTGGRRLELQVLLFGGCVVAATVYLLIGLSALTHDPVYRGLEPFAVLVFYAGTAYVITSHRIFDARQILLVGVEKITLVVAVAAVAYALDKGFAWFLSEPLALLATTVLALLFAAALNAWLDGVFMFYPQATTARQAIFEAARRETRVEKLEESFVSVLKGWGQSGHALIVSGAKDYLRGGGIELANDCAELRAMRQLRWATPERLARERPTPDRESLGAFMAKHGLGVLVLGEGPALAVLVGVGIAASRWPFTYPQVMQLVEIASIIESAMERAHFSVKAQHAEQLATVGLLGASLAHEIRNPLVTIKTFVQLLPAHHQDAAFRGKFFKLIGDEVNRIDRLTEQLLDLASPRAYIAEMVELHPLLRTSIDLVVAKASDKQIEFRTDFQAVPDLAWTDASAAKQVMLNLCFNAIQALESCDGDRWVRISTRNVVGGIEMAVADSGPGIAEEIRPRLFQPFQSTKSTGFGLGLAICSDILANLNATITVDPSAPGRGATFRIIFPCQPLSS